MYTYKCNVNLKYKWMYMYPHSKETCTYSISEGVLILECFVQ